MKTCPVCKARCFDDMEVCYGCMHRFEGERDKPKRAASFAAGYVFGASGSADEACASASEAEGKPQAKEGGSERVAAACACEEGGLSDADVEEGLAVPLKDVDVEVLGALMASVLKCGKRLTLQIE